MNKNKYKVIAAVSIILISMSLFSCSMGKQYKNIGDAIQLKNTEITIEKIEQYDTMEYVSPTDGYVFIAVKFNYKNITSSALEYKSLPIIAFMASDKTSYSVNYDASNVYALLNGVDYSIMTTSLDAGAARADAEVYEVPKNDLTGKEFLIKIDNTNTYIKVDVSQINTNTNQNNTTTKQ